MKHRLLVLTTLALMTVLTATNMHAAALREWTSSSGTKVSAELVNVDRGRAVLKNADGKQFAIGVSSLSAADQAHIREHLAAEKAAAIAANKGNVVRKTENVLPTYARGENRGSHALYSHAKFDAEVKYDGNLTIYPKDDEGNRILSPKFFAHVVCMSISKDAARLRTHWPVVAYDDPADPVENASLVHLKGTRKAVSDIVPFELMYAFKGNEIELWYRCETPKGFSDATCSQIRCEVAKMPDVIAKESLEEAQAAVEGYDVTLKFARKNSTTPRYTGSKSYGFSEAISLAPGDVDKVTVSGGVFGPRTVTFIGANDKETFVRAGNYSNMPLYNGFTVTTSREDANSNNFKREKLTIRIE